jgi:hypothetical protein
MIKFVSDSTFTRHKKWRNVVKNLPNAVGKKSANSNLIYDCASPGEALPEILSGVHDSLLSIQYIQVANITVFGFFAYKDSGRHNGALSKWFAHFVNKITNSYKKLPCCSFAPCSPGGC